MKHDLYCVMVCMAGMMFCKFYPPTINYDTGLHYAIRNFADRYLFVNFATSNNAF